MGGEGPAEPDADLPDGPRPAGRRPRRRDCRKGRGGSHAAARRPQRRGPGGTAGSLQVRLLHPHTTAEGTVRHARRRTGPRRRIHRNRICRSRIHLKGGREMSPTITTSSEANGNVSAATARAAAKAAVAAEQTGPQPLTLAKALNTAMADAMRADDSVLVFGEDVGMLGGVFRITDGLTKTFGTSRCFDTPLAESGIV